MEKHKCKLCLRNFSNGRALGGHMRSHIMNLHVPPKPSEYSPPPTIQLSFEAESSPSPSLSLSSSGEGEEEDNKSLYYGLRENPKRSFRIADPEFSSAAAADTGSVILQEDRESETESSKNVTRRRSKRAWKLGNLDKKMKLSQRNESASSVSDTTTEEDVAFCLMMLSRDSKWKNHDNNNIEEHEQLQQEDEELEEHEEEDEDDEEDDEDEESDGYEEMKNKAKTNRVRGGRYKCETCNKVFRSYQALGGHRASHKKIKVDHHHHHDREPELEHDDENVNNNINNGVVASSSVVPSMVDNRNSKNNKKTHECPVCFRVFASGQALGGHKRTHVITTAAATRTTGAKVEAEAEVATSKVVSSMKFGRESLIDLNLPAPVDDDDVSQFEDSAVSDAEFVKPVKVFPR